MKSSAERDYQVMTIVSAALQHPATERKAYLQFACQHDLKLYQEVSEVVDWEERMGGFLLEPLIVFRDFQPAFQLGETISGRFEIIRMLGAGGMGVVYEAFDRKRNQRIAIKVAKAGFRRLLSPELESALRVRHPNICLVNEIHTANTSLGEVDFLTMEFLDGETLSARLASVGKLDPKEATDIARQLCAGLAEAHRCGIIHRDLKSGNVILSRSAEGKPRAVITDFGLAGEAGFESGGLAGTPQYMAPELWQGDKPSQASDVYALGVILYEMVTGEQPFQDEKDQSRLTPPSGLTDGLDRCWDATAFRCLDASPNARPKAAEVLALLEKQPVRKTRLITLTVLIAAALTLAVREPFLKFFHPAGVRLAILPLEGTTDVEAIGSGALVDVADRLAQRRGATSTLVVIPASESFNNNVRSPQQAKQILNATHVLQIALRREGTSLIVQGAVIELTTQTHLYSISGTYSADRVGDLPLALAGAVSKALGLQGTPFPEAISGRAIGSYLEGLSYLRRDQFSFDLAIPLFREAAQMDLHSPLPLAGLSEALVLKYRSTHERKWIDEAEQVMREAEALNPDSISVLLARGRLEAARSHYEKALENYRRVHELEPRDVYVLLRIAAINDRLDLREEALDIYHKAIELEPGFYKPYEEFGVFFYFRGEYSQAADQLRKAVELAPGFYEAYLYLGAALSDMGYDEEAETAFLESLKLKDTSQALNGLGAIKAYQKFDSEALEFYRRSLKLDPNSYVCLMNLGDSSRRLRYINEARDFYAKGWDLALAELEGNPRSGYARAYLGYFAARLGDPRRAEQETEEALQLSPGDKMVIRRAVLTYEALGQRNQALEVAATASKQVLDELDRHPDLADFREDPRFRDLRTKTQKGG